MYYNSKKAAPAAGTVDTQAAAAPRPPVPPTPAIKPK
jgi:hypothetical protein